MTKICLFVVVVVVIVVSFNYFRSNLFYRGGTGSNLSIFKKAKNSIGQFIFFLGWGPFAYSYGYLHNSMIFHGVQTLCPTHPLWMILCLWLFLGCNLGWMGLWFLLFYVQEHPKAHISIRKQGRP